MKMDKTNNHLENMQLLGISYFSGIVYYKNVHTSVIHAENQALIKELLDTVVD